MLGLHCCVGAFSSCGEWMLPFVAVWASHCSGFFGCRGQAMGTWAQYLWCMGLVAQLCVES